MQAALTWLLRLPAVYFAAVVLDGGVFGAWAGELVYLGVVMFALVRRFEAGHWRSIKV